MSGSVQFALGESRLKTFRHALGALSKIGSDLLVEALPRQVRRAGGGRTRILRSARRSATTALPRASSRAARLDSTRLVARRAAPRRGLLRPRPTLTPLSPPPPRSGCVAQLVLRSVESSHSAIMTVSFDDAFFDAYDIYGSDVIQASASLKVRKGRAVGPCCELPARALASFAHGSFAFFVPRRRASWAFSRPSGSL